MNGSLLNNFSFTKIISGFNKTLNVVNKAIPVYKQVKPVIGNAKNVLNIFNASKQAKQDIINEEMLERTRPIVVNHNSNINNNSVKLDTLTFFQ